MNLQSDCQSCGSDQNRWTLKYPQLRIFQCESCESMSFFPEKKLDFGSLYSPKYFAGEEYEDYMGHREVHHINFRRKWKLLKRYLKNPINLFEMGCAHGFFVDYALKNDVLNAFGVDISEEAIAFAKKNFGFHFGLANQKPSFPFNCLVAWDVWEHLENPITLFSDLVSQLEPQGIVAMTTVDSSSFVARFRGQRWRQMHPPTHVHYPTKKALDRALSKMELAVLYHSHFGYFRALESYLAPLNLDKVVRYVDFVRKFPILVDLKDTQIVIAQKLG